MIIEGARPEVQQGLHQEDLLIERERHEVEAPQLRATCSVSDNNRIT